MTMLDLRFAIDQNAFLTVVPAHSIDTSYPCETTTPKPKPLAMGQRLVALPAGTPDTAVSL